MMRIPGYVEGHCHILPEGLDLQKLHLGSASSADDVLDAVSDRHRTHPEGWLQAVHYDQNRYGGIHLTRLDLDAISPDRPISLRHVNGHASIVNSAALKAAGITPDTADPAGGEFRRDANGAPDGVLFERAHELVTAAAPNPTQSEMLSAIRAAAQAQHRDGIVLSSDMQTGRFDLEDELLAYDAASGYDGVEFRLYVQWSRVFGPRGIGAERLHVASGLIRGVKIFADGAIGSRTAAIYGAYVGDPPAETSGQLIYPPNRLKEMILTADTAGLNVSVHAIGDYATDLVMDAFSECSEPSRHRLEHAMLLSDAQIERLASIGCFVNVQPEFLTHFGTSYQRNLGVDRASRLIRTRSLIDAGLRVSFGSDRPIVAGSPQSGIAVAVTRPEGFDPAENITLAEAQAAYTIHAAELTGDEGRYGELPGGAGAFGGIG